MPRWILNAVTARFSVLLKVQLLSALCALLFMVLLKWFPVADSLVVSLYRVRKRTINESFLIVTMNPCIVYITKDIERGV